MNNNQEKDVTPMETEYHDREQTEYSGRPRYRTVHQVRRDYRGETPRMTRRSTTTEGEPTYFSESESTPEVKETAGVAQSAPSWLTTEPVALQATIQAAIGVAIGFGMPVSSEQMSLILIFTAAVLAMITRQQVTPFSATGTTPTDPKEQARE